MRPIIISITIVLLLIFTSIGSHQYITKSSTELVKSLDSVEVLLYEKNWDKAKKELDNTQLKWDDIKTWWSVLINHDEIDNIDISLKRLEKYVETEGVALSLGELSALRLLFGHIKDTEEFNFQNIF